MISEETILKAIPTSGGIVKSIAEQVGMGRSALHRRILLSKTLKDAIQEERESTLDIAEHWLVQMIKEGEPWAIKYYLSTIGKSRGFTTRTEVEGDVRHSADVKVYLPDNGRDALTSGSKD